MELKKREEIIKALECCSGYLAQTDCMNCPLNYIDAKSSAECITKLFGYALVLIKELTKEIEDIEEDYERVYEQAEADVWGNMANGGTSCHWCQDMIATKAVQHYIEMAKRRLPVISPSVFDNIANDMWEWRNK